MQEPVVLVPGMLCDARVYGPQITALSSDHPVMVVPVTGGERIEEIASGLLDVLPRRFALAGLAMGAIVAMEILRRAPDRVTRIALMDTNPLAETPQTAADLEPLVIQARAGRAAELAEEMVAAGSLAPGPGRAEVVALLRDMAAHLGGAVAERQIRALQRRRDYQAVLRRCKVPALVACGRHDTVMPVKRHQFMADLIPDARLEVFEDAGHLPVLETPDAATQALRAWLAR